MPSGISLASILTAAAGSAAGAVVSGLIGGDKKGGQQQQQAAAAPAVEPVTPMPGPNDQAVQDAKRKSIVAQIQRQGRASTILTQGNAASETMG